MTESDLKMTRRGIAMSWPMLLIYSAILVVPWWVLANNISFDEIQKSMGLIIAPALLGIKAFMEKQREAPGKPESP